MMNVSPETTRVGWIGTGVMGLSMCGHFLTKGYNVTVYSRSKEKARLLFAKGAKWADSPAPSRHLPTWCSAWSPAPG
jgi:3-hydroxyisobutyrate dehydrogenase